MKAAVKICGVLGLCLLFWLLPGCAAAADLPNSAGENLSDMLELGDLEQSINDIAEYMGEVLGAEPVRELWESARRGEIRLDFAFLGHVLAAVFFKEVGPALSVFGQLLVLAVFSLLVSHLQNLQNSSGGVGELAGSVVYLAFLGIVLQVFRLAGNAAGEAVELMSDFLYALLPVLLTLLASTGAASSIALFNPALLSAVGISLHLLRVFVMPLLYISGALVVGGQISPNLKLSGLAKLAREVAMGVFGIMLTVFTAFLGLLGLSGAVIDGIGLKAVKTASGAFIPVVGRTLADVLDTVIATLLLLKNVIGVFGIVILLLVCIMPGVKILLLALAFRLAGAFAEPLGDKRLAEALTSLGGVVMLFFGVVAISGVFFFFIISITIGMGNLTFALR
jgi:stage III sporulation protein AE